MIEEPVRRPAAAWLSRLAGLADSPRRTAAAFAVGVFFSFSPFFGLQIVSGLGIAMALRLNRVAMFGGLCANLPWLMVPWYAVTTTAGAAMLGVPIADDITGRIGGLARAARLPRRVLGARRGPDPAVRLALRAR